MSADTATTQWFLGRLPDPEAGLRVFCFPFAGGGAGTYRPWLQNRPKELDFLPLQPPGRETRIREAPLLSMSEMTEAIVGVIAPWLDLPFAFFGYSLGSIVAFEVARKLRAAGHNAPRLLVVSARVAPHLPLDEHADYLRSDQALIKKVRNGGGTPEEVLQQPELLALLLPVLRADFVLNASYEFHPEMPLECPIVAYAGSADAGAPIPQVRAWARHTCAPFRLRLFPGTHFFIKERPLDVLHALFLDLAPYLDVACCPIRSSVQTARPDEC
jgi:medium-chain acyl-[acyl-carrier-protein] hydrolase